MRCDGSGLKLSAAVEQSTMDASCRLYNIGLQLERTQHEAAREHVPPATWFEPSYEEEDDDTPRGLPTTASVAPKCGWY